MDFQNVYKNGKSYANKYLVMYVLKNEIDESVAPAGTEGNVPTDKSNPSQSVTDYESMRVQLENILAGNYTWEEFWRQYPNCRKEHEFVNGEYSYFRVVCEEFPETFFCFSLVVGENGFSKMQLTAISARLDILLPDYVGCSFDDIIATEGNRTGFTYADALYQERYGYRYDTLRIYRDDFFYETTKYNPHSPYSASKASSDHFVRAYHDTYGMPTIVTNCSNNYGPYQFPEKLIPLFINNIRNRKPLPVYGKGENVRDWLFVEDHARAIDVIFHGGKIAETYNIGGFNEWKNIDIIKVVIRTTDRLLGRSEDEDMNLITYVTDRLGHDARYAIDSTKLQKELGWEPSLQFEEGIERTIKWYLENEEWLDNVTSGDYLNYYDTMYGKTE